MKTVQLPDRTRVPVLGQGTWRMGENKSAHAEEVAALRLGIDLGMTLIDTAEMYGEGGAEKVVADAIEGHASACSSSQKCIRTTHRGAHCRRMRSQPQAASDRDNRSLPAALARKDAAARGNRGNIRKGPLRRKNQTLGCVQLRP